MNNGNTIKSKKPFEMTEEAKEARRIYRREYQRKWNRNNPDKVKMYQARYWERKAKAAEVNSTEEVNV